MADTHTKPINMSSSRYRPEMCFVCDQKRRYFNVCGKKGQDLKRKINFLVPNHEFDKFLERNSNTEFGFCRSCFLRLNCSCEFVQQIQLALGLQVIPIKSQEIAGANRIKSEVQCVDKNLITRTIPNNNGASKIVYKKVVKTKASGSPKEINNKNETVHVLIEHHQNKPVCPIDKNASLFERQGTDMCMQDISKNKVLFATGLMTKSKIKTDLDLEKVLPKSNITPVKENFKQNLTTNMLSEKNANEQENNVLKHRDMDRDQCLTQRSVNMLTSIYAQDAKDVQSNTNAIEAAQESVKEGKSYVDNDASSVRHDPLEGDQNKKSAELQNEHWHQIIKVEHDYTAHEMESDMQVRSQSLSSIDLNTPSVISKFEPYEKKDKLVLQNDEGQKNAKSCSNLNLQNSKDDNASIIENNGNKINLQANDGSHEQVSAVEANQNSSDSNNQTASSSTQPGEHVENTSSNNPGKVSTPQTAESKQNHKIRRQSTVEFLKRNMFTDVKRTPETDGIAKIVMSNEVMLKAVERKILGSVNDMCVKLTYRGKPDSSILDRYRTMDMLLQHCDDLLDEIVTEIADNLPFLLDIMCTIVTGGRTPRECDVAPIAAAYAILMHARSERLSAWHRLICLITMKGRMSERALSRLGQFGVGTSAGTRERLNKELAQHKDTPLVLQLTTAGVISNFLAPVCQGKIEFKKPMSQWKKDYLIKKKQDRIEAAKKREKEKERKKAEVAQRKAKRSSVVKLQLKNMPAMVDCIPASGGVPNKYEAGPLIQLPGAEKKKATPKTIIVSKQGAFVRVVNTNSAAFRSDVSSALYKDILTSSSKAVGTSPSTAVRTAPYKDIGTVPCTAVSTASITAVGTASSKAVGIESSTTVEAASMRDVSTSTDVGTTTSTTDDKASVILDMNRKRPALGVRGTTAKTVKKKKITWAGVEIPEDAETLQEVMVYPPGIYAKDSSSLVAEESFPMNITGIASNADGVIAQQGAQQVSTLCSTNSQEFRQSGFTAQPMHLSVASDIHPYTSVHQHMQANMTNSTLADCSLQQAGISSGIYAQTNPTMPNNTVFNVNKNFNFPQTSGGVQRMDACRYSQSSGKQSSFGQQTVAKESCSNPEYEIITSIMAVGESLQVEKYPSVPSEVQPGSQNMDPLTHHTVIPQHTVECSQTNAEYGYSNQTR